MASLSHDSRSLGIGHFEEVHCLRLQLDHLAFRQLGASYADGIPFGEIQLLHHLRQVGISPKEIVAGLQQFLRLTQAGR